MHHVGEDHGRHSLSFRQVLGARIHHLGATMADRAEAIELSAAQRAGIGMLVGSIEQSIMRPSVYWKSELQQGRFSLARAVNPRYCYRGLPVAIVSIAPITGIQFGATAVYKGALQRYSGRPTSDGDMLAAGIFAGMTSALVQSPCQLVEVNQQNFGGTMTSTARRVIADYGFSGLYRGLSMTACREAVFCSSYIAVAPYFKKTLKAKYPELSDGSAVGASSIIAGALGAVLSHPADTLKTRLQGGLFSFKEGELPPAARVRGPLDALQQMHRSGNLVSSCYSGFTPRLFRLMVCTYIYSTLTDALEGHFKHWLANPYSLRLNFEVSKECRPSNTLNKETSGGDFEYEKCRRLAEPRH